MTTARVQPRGSASFGCYYYKILEEDPSYTPVIYGRHSISNDKELGYSFLLSNEYPLLFLFDYKHQATKDTKWSPAIASDLTVGLIALAPWVGGRVIVSKNMFVAEPYVFFEFGFPPYNMVGVGLRISNNAILALHFETNYCYRWIVSETFPDSPREHDSSLAIGMELRFTKK